MVKVSLKRRLSSILRRSSSSSAIEVAAPSRTSRANGAGITASLTSSSSGVDQASELRRAAAGHDASLRAAGGDSSTTASSRADDRDDAAGKAMNSSPAANGSGATPPTTGSRFNLLARGGGGAGLGHRDDRSAALDHVLGLVERIGRHLESQEERSERMVAMLERMPQAMEALPEIRRNSASLVEAVTEHFGAQRVRDEQMRSAIVDLAGASQRQSETLGIINERLAAHQETQTQLVATLSEFRETLGGMNASSNRSIDVLNRMVESDERRQNELSRTLAKHGRLVIALLGLCAFMSATGLIVSLVALIRVLN